MNARHVLIGVAIICLVATAVFAGSIARNTDRIATVFEIAGGINAR